MVKPLDVKPLYKSKREAQRVAVRLLNRGFKVKLSRHGSGQWQVGVY